MTDLHTYLGHVRDSRLPPKAKLVQYTLLASVDDPDRLRVPALSCSEIGAGCNMSAPTVRKHLATLEAEGWLARVFCCGKPSEFFLLAPLKTERGQTQKVTAADLGIAETIAELHARYGL